MFTLNIGNLSEHIKQEDSTLETMNKVREACHNAMIALTNDGFIGRAQIACMERFNTWINTYIQNMERLSYLQVVLKLALADANDIRKRYENLPSTLGGLGEASADDTGVICLYDEGTLHADATEMIDDKLNNMRSNVNDIYPLIDRLYYGSNIAEHVQNVESDFITQENRLREFASEFSNYVTAVRSFEDDTAKSLKVAGSDDFDMQKAFETAGFAVDVVEGISSSTKLFITGAKSVRDVTVVVDGKYLRLSGYRAGRGLTSRYLLDGLDSHPKANALLKAEKIGKVAEGVGYGLAVAEVAYDGYAEYNRNPYLPKDFRTDNTVAEVSASAVSVGASIAGGWAGAKAGAALGAMVGSIIPGVGTAIGAAVGGFLGAIGGSLFAGWLTDGLDTNGDGKTLKDDLSDEFKDWNMSDNPDQRYGKTEEHTPNWAYGFAGS